MTDITNIQSQVVNISEYERHAQQSLDPKIWSYFSGAAGDEITQRKNSEAWSELSLQPTILSNLVGSNTRLRIFGRTLAHPIMVAPFAFQKLLHPQGEVACAYAAAVLEAGFIVSDQSSIDPLVIAKAFLQEVDRGPLWHQLYWTQSRKEMIVRLNAIESAGYEAIVLTVDAPVHGARDRERRAGFKLPPEFHGATSVNSSLSLEALLAQAPSWSDVAWLAQQTQLPLLLKGVTHPRDALRATEVGCAGIIVSNHGGRVLDTTIATAIALPRIKKEVGDSIQILVDGGIRRGTDVLKAIALGADAVLIGKPIAMALGCAGPQGVAHVIRLLWDELKLAMALSGCRTLQTIPVDLVVTHPHSSTHQ